MIKWTVNLIMLFVGALCLVTLLASDWGLRFSYAGLFSVGTMLVYLALLMVPIFEINWTMLVLLIFSAGISAICPVSWVIHLLIFGGVLAGSDILLRYFDLTPFADGDNEFLERGGYVSFVFPLAGFVLGAAIAIIALVIQFGGLTLSQ